jgi:predicted AlkP superfamily phosphohydrolase/phosphomutase
MSSKVLVIGLDGATEDIVMPMIEKGMLPNLAKIVKTGASTKLASAYPPLSPTAWSSFMTGTNPGKHGVFGFTIKQHKSYYVEVATANTIATPTIWDILSDAGKKVSVLNMPMLWPPWPINGFMVCGMGAPSFTENFTYPDDLGKQLWDQTGRYIGDVLWTTYGDDRIGEFMDELTLHERQRYDMASSLLAKDDWDVFVIIFTGVDRLQHRTWHALEQVAKNGESPGDELSGRVVEYMKVLDGYVGKLMEQSGEETTTMVMSDHGFGPCKKAIEVNNLMHELGYLKYNTPDPKQEPKGGYMVGAKRVLKAMGLNKKRVMKIAKLFGVDPYKYLERASKAIGRIDWENTRAFCYSIDGVYINLKGRERFGSVEPGDEAERLPTEISQKLLEVRDPETGEQIFRAVARKEELYSGPLLEQAPDLIFTDYDRSYHTHFQLFQGNDDLSVFSVPEGRLGTHREDGILMIHGPGVKRGLRMDRANIIDLAPTILGAVGLGRPDYFDGRLLEEAFEEGRLAKGTDGGSGPSGSPSERRGDLSKQEGDLIAERLKGLGYID